MTNLLWYLAGVSTLPLTVGAFTFTTWAFSKNRGIGGCLLDWCRHREMELGKHFNITIQAHTLAHRWLMIRTPKHRRELDAYWQAKKDAGRWVHPKALRRLA